jgi:transposase
MDRVHARRAIAPPERRKLHRMKRQKTNQVNSTHARIILLSYGGVCNGEIAQYVGQTPQWVRQIIQRFNKAGVGAIEWYPYWQDRGTPRKFFADLVEQIAEVALSSPKSLIGMTQWSLSKLRDYLVSQKIVARISLDWLRALLRRFGIRWRHTKTWKESKDPQFRQKYRRIRRLYRNRPAGGRRICVDEWGPLNLLPRHGQCLAKKGKKRVERHRATYQRTQGVRHFLAAYDLETGHLFGQFTSRKTWKEWLAFLKWLRRRYRPQETLHLVLDNYGTHLKKEVLDWAKTHNIKFYFVPTDASWLNRIECQFTALKKFALDNSDYRSHEEQQEAIESYLAWRNGRREIAIEAWRDHIQKSCQQGDKQVGTSELQTARKS